ncbi:TlpA family protein disulfide reductase [Planctomycetota bacterium]
MKCLLWTGLVLYLVLAVAGNSRATVDLQSIDLGRFVNACIEQEDLEGQVIFVVMWGLDCDVSVAEIPTLNRVYESCRNHLSFVMVALERQGASEEAIRGLLIGRGIKYPTCVGGRVDGYPSKDLPAHILFGQDGEMITQETGTLSSEMKIEVKKALLKTINPLVGTYQYTDQTILGLIKKIKKGSPYGKVLAELRAIRTDEDAEAMAKKEAFQLIQLMKAYVAKRMAKASLLIEVESPVIAVEEYKKIAKMFSGDKVEVDAVAAQKKLETDLNYQNEQTSWNIWLETQNIFRKYGAKNKRENKKMADNCSYLKKKYPDTGGARQAKILMSMLKAEGYGR